MASPHDHELRINDIHHLKRTLTGIDITLRRVAEGSNIQAATEADIDQALDQE